MKTKAQKLDWKVLPQQNSPRVSLLAQLAKLGINTKQLNNHFGWTHQSHMAWHYLGQNLACSQDAPATRLIETLESNKNSKLQLLNKRFYSE